VGSAFDITWSTAVPMVRLHVNDYGVGVAEAPVASDTELTTYPNPMDHSGRIVFNSTTGGPAYIHVYNAMGSAVRSIPLGNVPSGITSLDLETSGLSSGAYVLHLVLPTGTQARRIVIAH